jgi:ribosomal protein S14
VHRRAWARAEQELCLYRFMQGNDAVSRRSLAWAQESLVVGHPTFRTLVVQNLCTNSGRKRAVLRFFQLHRLELRSAFVGLRLPGLYYYY